MSEGMYQKGVVALSGGLDLVSPRFAVTPGTLADGLNYETYGVGGYSVIEGLEPYDGLVSCYLKDWVVVKRTSGSNNFAAGQYLLNGSNYFGVVVAWDAVNSLLSYVIINPAAAPKIQDTIVNNQSTLATCVIGSISKASQFYVDQSQFLAAQKAIYEALLPIKKPIYPYVSYAKNVIPHGLHWYKGRLHAIVDSLQISFNAGATTILPGDKIFSALGDFFAGTVMSVSVTSGAASTSDLAGTMVVRPDGDGPYKYVGTGVRSIRRPNGATGTTLIAPAFTVLDTQLPNSPGAQLFAGPLDDDYQTSDQINTTAATSIDSVWAPVDMGWQVPFKTDNTTTGVAPSTTFRGSFLSDVLTSQLSASAFPMAQTLSAGGTQAKPLGAASTTVPPSTDISAILNDSSAASYIYITSGATTGQLTTQSAVISSFDFSGIPAGAIVSGIEVTATSSGAADASIRTNFTLSGAALSAVTSQTKSTEDVVGFNIVSVVGGPADLWGLNGLSTTDLLAAVKDNSFGLKFSIDYNTTTSFLSVKLSGVSLKVYYRSPITHYYAHDPSTTGLGNGQDLQIDIPYYTLSKGQFNPGGNSSLNGTGTMSIYNITPLDSTGGGGSAASITSTIGTGWELRTARDGGGQRVAIFTAQMTAAQLPSRASMDRVRKRFEIITANYYANVDWVAMYGVDGVGPSWQYDGSYFYNVYTALPSTEDMPSHICYHRNYAVLGYENGQCIVSVPGEPTNFVPLLGSTLYPFGERITGLLSLNGTALGVLCESSIHALSGDVLAAVDANNAVSQIISPYSGAIEYSVVDAGIPLFMDFRGISTIDATNKYGDFENGRVSYQITPLLSTRVNDRFSYQAASTNLIFAQPIRNKNQVRYYFADGLILTCGLPAGERNYEFTKQQYVSSADFDSMVPVAMCTATSRSGRDLIFGTFELLPFDQTTIVTPSNAQREGYVYAVDKGTRFFLAPIKHFAQLNYMTLSEPNKNITVRRIRFELLTYHFFDEYISLSSDYRPPSNKKRSIKIDPVGQGVRTQKDADYLVVPVEGVGNTFAFEVGGEHIYPGHVLQAIIVETMPGRDQNGNSPNQKLT